MSDLDISYMGIYGLKDNEWKMFKNLTSETSHNKSAIKDASWSFYNGRSFE